MPQIPVPPLDYRPHRVVGGDLAAGTSLASGSSKSRVVCVAGLARVRVRIKTATVGGTLNVIPIRPIGTDDTAVSAAGEISAAKVTEYTTGTGTATVTAGTEQKVDLDLYGESYVLVELEYTAGAGTITFCDISGI